MSANSSQSSSPLYIRPVLPSLQSLGLPQPIAMNHMVLNSYDDERLPVRKLHDYSTSHRARQSSISSTTSSCTDASSCSSSPTGWESNSSESSRIAASPQPVRRPSRSFSLVRSTVEEANAFVLVSPNPAPYVESISALSRANAASNQIPRQNQALLLVGPAVEYLRHPSVRIAKGARVHPYRIVSNAARRHSTNTSSNPSSQI